MYALCPHPAKRKTNKAAKGEKTALTRPRKFGAATPNVVILRVFACEWGQNSQIDAISEDMINDKDKLETTMTRGKRKSKQLIPFCKNLAGTKVKMQFFGPNCQDGEGNLMSFSAQMAVVSHYLHNSEYPTAETYVEKAKGLMEDMYRSTEPNLPDGFCAMDSPLQKLLFQECFNVPFLPAAKTKFTFIDLFAGIGGFRMAMQSLGGRCIFSSEWNEHAQKTYFENYGEVPFGDITKEETKGYIPKQFDILCAGFPCQPFSIAGVSKKKSLGRETGFKDKTQGTLFFDVADIISRRRPKAFFLENVKNLLSHDRGNTFKVIHDTLDELNYSLHYLVMDGKSYVPQHRERIMLVGFDRNVYGGKENFEFPSAKESGLSIKDILDEEVPKKYTLTDKLWNYLQTYAEKHKAKGNGFGYGLVDLDGVTRTLSARYYKDGSEILIPQGDGKNPRRLTPRECARLMGYPDNFIIDAVSDVQAYRQFGNSVVMPLITAVAAQIIKAMEEYGRDSVQSNTQS